MVGTRPLPRCHRLPQCAGVREEPRPGCRPDPDDGQDRPACRHHPSPGRASQPDDPEGLRRGHAGAVSVHRDLPGSRGRPGRSTASMPSWQCRSTTCCCRSSGLRLRAGLRQAHRACRPSADRASCGTTRSGQYIRDASMVDSTHRGTTAIPGAGLLLPARSSATGQALARVAGRSGFRQEQVRQRTAQDRAGAAGQGLEDVQAMAASMTAT